MNYLQVSAIMTGLMLSRPAEAMISWGSAAPEWRSENHDVVNAISRADCEDGSGIDFVVLSDAPADSDDTLEIWATDSSVDCSLLENQQSICTKLGESDALFAGQFSISVPLRDIISAVPDADAVSCTHSMALPTQVTLFFIESSMGSTGDVLTVDLSVDLLGPPAPAIVNLAPAGETSLTIFSAMNDVTEDVAALSAYCAPADLEPCGANALVPGMPPPEGQGLSTSGITNNFNSATVPGLSLGVRYACAVAAHDTVNNAGPLSVAACTTLQELEQPGQSEGGCSCSTVMSPHQARMWPWLLLGLTGLAGASRRRARHSHRLQL